MLKTNFLLIPLCSLAPLVSRAEPALPLPRPAAVFVEQHCVECHDPDTKKGDLDLTTTPFDLTSEKAFSTWIKVHDRVRDGEMPPRKKGAAVPDPVATAEFLKQIAAPMVAADQVRAAVEGRAVWRRLNRYEYENALRDLLHAPWLQIRDALPEDGEAHRFNKSGEALTVSHVQMSSYLAAADYALRQVMAPQADRPATTNRRFYAREQSSFAGKMKFGQFNRSPERATFPMVDTQAQPDVIEGKSPITVGAADPKTRDHEAMGLVASTYEPIEVRFDKFIAPVGGRYRLKLAGYTFWAGPLSEKKWWSSDRNAIFPGRRGEPVTLYAQTPPRLLRWIGAVDFSPEASSQEIEAYLLAGETIRPDAARLFRSRPSNWHNPLAEKDGSPGVAFRWLDIEGPIYDQWPTAGHRLLFGDLPLKAGATSADPIEVVSKDPHADAARLLRHFMVAAYRRPVPEAEVARFLGVIDIALKSGAGFAESMLTGYGAVLCSPEFVCVEEKPGHLDDLAIASRLSLFLWNSPPDESLRALATAGELRKPEVLRAQTERMLSDERSRRFVDAFLDYWIDLRKIVATAPDSVLYPDYYLDDLLTESAERETQMFFAELLRGNLPTANIVSSDFAMLNERLARHYGLPAIDGVTIRRVSLPKDSVRGGLLTQASVLKVTANGTTTSPVIRGAWVMERILGKTPPPPPPSVPAIEPDTRGAHTIREQLDKHRSLPSCAACHAKIDPAGFALESFDVMGGFRDHYRAIGDTGDKVEGFGHNGQPFTFRVGPPIDPSGKLPDGGDFKDVRELKALLLKDPRQIARNMVGQFIAYSTGTPVRFGDRPAVEMILDRAAASQYGVRALIDEIVQSELFQMK